MRRFWFAIVVLLVLGFLTGIYERPSVTGEFMANMPPKWDFPADEFDVENEFSLDLDEAFFDPDGDPLSYSVRGSDDVAAGIKGTRLIVKVPQGESHVWVTATDGTAKVDRQLRFFN